MRSRTARLEVHAGEADRGVTPHVDAELIGLRELGAHGESESRTELRGLAPADVGQWRRRFPERRKLIARAAGIMRDDGVGDVDGLLQIPQHAIGVERRVVADVSFGIHLASHGSFVSAISVATFLGSFALPPWSFRTSSSIASSTILASPAMPSATGTSLLMSPGSSVAWMSLGAGRHFHAEVRLGERAADAEDEV